MALLGIHVLDSEKQDIKLAALLKNMTIKEYILEAIRIMQRQEELMALPTKK